MEYADEFGSWRKAEPNPMATTRLLFVVGLLVILFSGMTVSAASLNYDDTLKQLAAAEKNIQNLRVEGTSVIETQAADSQWKPTDISSDVTATLQGPQGGLIRMDCRRDVGVSGGEHAPSSLFDRSYVASWNGRVGTVFQLRAGPLGQQYDSRQAWIYNEPPVEAYGDANAWGASFSNYFYQATLSQTLSQYIEYVAPRAGPHLPGCFWTAETQMLNGVEAIDISVGRTGRVRFDWWIDPKRACALLRQEYHVYQPDGPLANFRRTEVAKLIEAAPGVWYPTEAMEYTGFADAPYYDPKNNVPWRIHYVAKSVVANDPKLDPHVFEITIPANYNVVDVPTGKSYKIGPTTQPLNDDLKPAAGKN
jgi:hypothetical protein